MSLTATEQALARIEAATNDLLSKAALVHARSESQSGTIRYFLAGPEVIEYGFMTADGHQHWRPAGVDPIETSRTWAEGAVHNIAHAQLVQRTWTASVASVCS